MLIKELAASGVSSAHITHGWKGTDDSGVCSEVPSHESVLIGRPEGGRDVYLLLRGRSLEGLCAVFRSEGKHHTTVLRRSKGGGFT